MRIIKIDVLDGHGMIDVVVHGYAEADRAPDFVKMQISIKVADFGVWLREKHRAGEEWVNIDVKAAKSGRWYAAVNTYKREDKPKEPERRAAPKTGSKLDDLEDDIPWDVIFKRLHAPSGLGFYLRTDIIEWKDGSCRPATGEEMALWACIREQQAALQRIDDQIGHFAKAPANDSLAIVSVIGDVARAAKSALEKWRIEP